MNTLSTRQSYRLVLLVVALISVTAIRAQDGSGARVTTSSVKGFPLAFYLPETGLSAGGLGIYAFRKDQDTTVLKRPSTIQLGAAYTLRNQLLLFVPYEIYLNNGEYRLQGELGYYRYLYNYFGLGPSSQVDDLETYDVNFPRVNVQVLKQLTSTWLAGVGYAFDYFDITRVEQKGILARESPTGIAGGSISGPLLKVLYDSRNHIFEPTAGMLADVSLVISDTAFGSDYSYRKYQVDVRKYWLLRPQYVLAARWTSTYASEGAPFFQYPYVGSTNQGRGLADRRFIAQHVTTLQAELRMMLWQRLGVVAFSSFNIIGDDFLKADQVRQILAGGIGLRYVIDKRELTRIRVDVAGSSEGLQIYLTLNEAF